MPCADLVCVCCSWSDWDAAGEYMHVGHPETFNFTFERMAAEDLRL